MNPAHQRPIAISPIYSTSKRDEPLELYRGELRLLGGDGQEHVRGTGVIRFSWEPFPRLPFEVELPLLPPIDETVLSAGITVQLVDDPGGQGSGVLLGVDMNVDFASNDATQTLTGGLIECTAGNPCATDSVIFHVANFIRHAGDPITDGQGRHWRGRFALECPPWRIDLDEIPLPQDLRTELARRGGFLITHVGRITRLDGAPVAFDELTRLRSALRWWLSLVRGQRTEPILMVGVHDGAHVWEIWHRPIVARWIGQHTWLPIHPTHSPAVGLTSILASLLAAESDETLNTGLARGSIGTRKALIAIALLRGPSSPRQVSS